MLACLLFGLYAFRFVCLHAFVLLCSCINDLKVLEALLVGLQLMRSECHPLCPSLTFCNVGGVGFAGQQLYQVIKCDCMMGLQGMKKYYYMFGLVIVVRT